METVKIEARKSRDQRKKKIIISLISYKKNTFSLLLLFCSKEETGINELSLRNESLVQIEYTGDNMVSFILSLVGTALQNSPNF